MVDYLNRVTDAIPKLREYADLAPAQVQARFAELRNAGWLFFTATGLAIARIGWAIRKDGLTGWESHRKDGHRRRLAPCDKRRLVASGRCDADSREHRAQGGHRWRRLRRQKIGSNLPSLSDKKAGTEEDSEIVAAAAGGRLGLVDAGIDSVVEHDGELVTA